MTDYTAALSSVMTAFNGSSGEVTTALFQRLQELGPPGALAVDLFRAQKNSARAKVYRGRSYRGAAYDRKQWAMGNLAKRLTQESDSLGIRWGWKIDPDTKGYPWVLYVELPGQGQVSFHTAERGEGPDYSGEWDGVRGASDGRICQWIARVLCSTRAVEDQLPPEKILPDDSTKSCTTR